MYLILLGSGFVGHKVTIIFKIILIFFLFFHNVFAVEWKYKTLIDWSEACFKKLPEELEDYETVLDPGNFKKTLKSLTEEYASSAWKDTENWLRREQVEKVDLKKVETGEGWDFSGKLFEKEKDYTYVQKLKVDSGSEICFMGDIHGSLHSLLRNLWRLVKRGNLNNDFKIIDKVEEKTKKKTKFYMVFLGDYLDRGHYGMEVLYTLLRLKFENWDRVFLLRGNHEEAEQWMMKSLREMEEKFGEEQLMEYRKFLFVFLSFLPSALFLGSGKDNKGKTYFIQCCHGGINPFYQTKKLFDSDKIFEKIDTSDDPKNFVQVDMGNYARQMGTDKFFGYAGFSWSDFSDGDSEEHHPNAGRRSRGVGFTSGKKAVKKYMEDNNLKAFFRGHQHNCFGLKMLPKGALSEEELEKKRKCETFYYWKSIIPENKRANNKFSIHEFYPVFTFSTACSTPGIRHGYDCFGILKTADMYEKWKLKVYETDLVPGIQEVRARRKTPQARKYFAIGKIGSLGDSSKDKDIIEDGLIAIKWHDSKLTEPLKEALINKAKINKAKSLKEQVPFIEPEPKTKKTIPEGVIESELSKKVGVLQQSLEDFQKTLNSLSDSLTNVGQYAK